MVLALLLAAVLGATTPANVFITPNLTTVCKHYYEFSYLLCAGTRTPVTVRLTESGEPQLRRVPFAANGFESYNSTRSLSYGETWRESGFRCLSRRNGLTCWNSHGHGFWIGRARGVSLF